MRAWASIERLGTEGWRLIKLGQYERVSVKLVRALTYITLVWTFSLAHISTFLPSDSPPPDIQAIDEYRPLNTPLHPLELPAHNRSNAHPPPRLSLVARNRVT